VIVGAAKSVGGRSFRSACHHGQLYSGVLAYCAGGRLFRPLAFTKTFSMFFASFLGVTLVPVLMLLLIRGKIVPEKDNPINRFLIRTYQPLVNFVLRYRWFTLGCALVILALTIFPFSRPAANSCHRSMRARCSTCRPRFPGCRSPRRPKILQIQDRQLKKIPEAMTVFGKAGQADTPTDPAPLSMFETVVALKPPNEWRKGMTWDKLLAEVNANIKTPGMASILWMPIQTRTEMLTTGFRSVLGIKVFGPDLSGIQKLAVQIEKELVQLRIRAARSPSAQSAGIFWISSLIAKRPRATAKSWRCKRHHRISHRRQERHDDSRRARALFRKHTLRARLREDSTRSNGYSFPRQLGAGSDLDASRHPIQDGSPSVRSENGKLVGFVFVDITTSDIAGYVRKASQLLGQRIHYRPVTTSNGRDSSNICKLPKSG